MNIILQFFRNIKYGFYNLFKWSLIIWQDKDWDQYYIYKILQFKLKNMIQ